MKNIDSMPSGSGSARGLTLRRRVTFWALVWALSFCTVTLAIKQRWWSPGGISIAVCGTAVLGLATVLAYRAFLLGADELRRKIEVEALALAFGVGVFGGLAVWLLAVSGILEVKDLAFLFVAMILTHVVGVFLGLRRYA